MRAILFILFSLVVMPAQAATFKYNLIFDGDSIGELQRPLGEDRCFPGDPCFPANYRIPFGFFGDLSIGQNVTGTVKLGDLTIAGRRLPVEVFGTGPDDFIGIGQEEGVSFKNGKISFGHPGIFSNVSEFCEPELAPAGLPDGFCGYFYYEAEFTITGVSEIPLPASGLLLLAGLGLMGAWRARRG
ncbi:MAG: PEP-CTERM sorting domain-containing protein [Pseudomonadota bacterium]